MRAADDLLLAEHSGVDAWGARSVPIDMSRPRGVEADVD
jgi:hypothetical protein